MSDDIRENLPASFPDNDNLGVCGLCGRDPQALERQIKKLEAEVERLAGDLSRTESRRMSARDKLEAVEGTFEKGRDRLWLAVRNLRHCGERQHDSDSDEPYEPGPMAGPLWGRVAYVFGVGSTAAIELCRGAGCDPHEDK